MAVRGALPALYIVPLAAKGSRTKKQGRDRPCRHYLEEGNW
jgi:hypothetical protein